MEFTKTQQRLIDRASQNTEKIVVVQTGYRTHVKAKEYGDREFNAAIKLVKAGVLRYERTDRFHQQARNAYGSDHWSDHLYTLVIDKHDLSPAVTKALNQIN